MSLLLARARRLVSGSSAAASSLAPAIARVGARGLATLLYVGRDGEHYSDRHDRATMHRLGFITACMSVPALLGPGGRAVPKRPSDG